MLQSLCLQNLAVIKEMDITLSGGLTVLTGETGAGKSIVIDAIGIIFGNKPARDIIREGEDKASASALFGGLDADTVSKIRELGVNLDENDDGIYIRRDFTADGRTVNKINGKNVSQTLLKEITKLLMNIHNQYDSQILLQRENHIMLCDEFFMMGDLLTDYKESYDKLNDIKSKIAALSRNEKEKYQMVDLYKFQMREIDGAKLRENEEEKLEDLKRYVQNNEKIANAVDSVNIALTDAEQGAAAAQVKRAVTFLSSVDKFIPDAPELIEKLNNIESELIDISEIVRGSKNGDETNPTETLDKIEKRLSQISRLKRKYGSSINEILEYRKKVSDDLDNVIFAEERLEHLKSELAEVSVEIEAKANRLSEKRLSMKKTLEDMIINELADLEMENAAFVISIEKNTDAGGNLKYTPRGADAVEFLISTNTGDSLKPLGKIVSGGELSRIMLALKSVFAISDNVGTIIFDEIDTGISGKTSHKIGQKLKDISKYIQVLCVTHSAQIASLSDTHYLIKKEETGGRTISSIVNLDREQRIAEIARIMGGITITDTLLKTASEMVEGKRK